MCYGIVWHEIILHGMMWHNSATFNMDSRYETVGQKTFQGKDVNLA